MDAFTLSVPSRALTLPLPPSSSSHHRLFLLRRRNYRPHRFLSSSSDPPPDLDQWDRMDLKFGHLIGEDPELTLAEVMGRKVNPNASFLDIEKSIANKSKKKKDEESGAVKVPLNWDIKGPVLGLRAPNRPRKGGRDVTEPSLMRPEEKVVVDEEAVRVKEEGSKVELRKPVLFPGDEAEVERLVRVKTRKGGEGVRKGMLLKKPELVRVSESDGGERVGLESSVLVGVKQIEMTPRPVVCVEEVGEEGEGSESSEGGLDRTYADDGIDSPQQSLSKSSEDISQAILQEKPSRLDSPVRTSEAEEVEVLGNKVAEDAIAEFSLSLEQGEYEESDWRRAEDLLRTGGREEVEFVSCCSRGFVVSFGSLVGFLPYRNLGTRWKFLAFESWLRKKGLDPSLYRQNLGIVRSYSIPNEVPSLKESETTEFVKKDDGNLNPGMKFEELLQIYDREKLKFLSSFIGQRIRASIIQVDRDARKILFSGRPKENEEVVEKKKHLMAKLSVGDIVKCCVKKITYFGVFVEVEGVQALIHQSEISWDIAFDSSLFFKIGQIVDAKVHQLDYALERITLSLKEISPVPLNEALESVVGESSPFGTSIEASPGDDEQWDDVELLVKELEQIDGITSVTKGRFFISPGLAPTFQVYMAFMFENQYKLLARYGKKVQEVFVQTSLDKDQIKEAVLTCASRIV